MILAMNNDIISLLQTNTVMLTPNQRLANYYLHEYQEIQQENGLLSWPTPRILPFANWLLTTWQHAVEQGLATSALLLNKQQELLLWRHVINSTDETSEFLNINETAKLAQQAFSHMSLWCIPWHESLFRLNPDTTMFWQWAQRFQQQYKKHNYITNNELSECLYATYKKNPDLLPQQLILSGFDEIPPLHQKLLKLFQDSGCNIIDFNEKKSNSSAMKIACQNTDDELTTMGLWVKQLLIRQPKAKIGCVIPNLNDLRVNVKNKLAQILLNSLPLTDDATELPFNISAGQEFATFPLIHTAFIILKSCRKNLPINHLIKLLRSPFIVGSEVEFSQRSLLIEQLFSLGSYTINLLQILPLCERYCPILSSHIRSFLGLKIHAKTHAKPNHWASIFSQQLIALGWPGERKLNTVEYQLLTRWQELLEEFASLNWLTGDISFQQAYEILYDMAFNLPFQPQSPRTTLQVLGLLEASGQQFDYLWIMGLHDGVFPDNPQPNPFIPVTLQREYGTPRASADRELQVAKRTLSRLRNSTNQLIISYPCQEDDRDLRPSPLFHDLPELTHSDLNLADYEPLTQRIYQTSQIETLNDNIGPKVNLEQGISGGTAIFKYQAQCPFRAFALFRLDAHGLDSPVPGLSPIERGSLLHRSLENIWREISNQETLLRLSDEQLRILVEEKVRLVLNEYGKQSQQSNPILLAIEQTRLQNLLLNWLNEEKKRRPFRVIATEQKQKMTLAGLEVSVQVDRIDELENGNILIIDYKTGTPSVYDWFGERPNEPQLPIYCIGNDKPIHGLAFAQINAEKSQYKGIAENDVGITGIKPITQTNQETICVDWSEQVNAWQNIMENLAQQFIEGYAEVDPSEGNKTCQFCDLQSFCRIYENNE